MCERLEYRLKPNSRIDKCLKNIIGALNGNKEIQTLACCCGHGRYPLTIIVEDRESGYIYELVSGKYINRKRNFYRSDKDGYYYIPEVSKPKK